MKNSAISRNYYNDSNNNIYIGEINNLKNNIRNLKEEIKDLKRQKDIDKNNFNDERIKLEDEIKYLKNQKNIDIDNFNTERKKFKDEIIIMNNNNLKNEKNLNIEIEYLKESNKNLRKENEKLKYSKILLNNDFERMENKLIRKNIKLKQLNVIQFYANKEIKEGNYDNNNYIQNIFLNEIKNNYGLNIDSNIFKEISLYYIKSKLIENLTDLKTKNIFSNPIIAPDGKTYEKDNLNMSKNYLENKLVLEICKILRENKNKLTFENFKDIKKLLISKETGNFYKNPIVIALGVNKGETIEDTDNVIFGYKNEVIKNIIEDIRELLDDDFFNFEISEKDEMISITNNTNTLNIIGFDEV